MLTHRSIGSGPTVVLQHGFLGGGSYWLPLAGLLSQHFRIVIPDLPGFAGSAAFKGGRTISDLASAVVELMDDLKINHFTVVGHSLGGIVAQEIAATSLPRLEKLVLYGTACNGLIPGRFENFDQSIARLRDHGVPAHAERVVPTWFVRGKQDPMYETALGSSAGLTAENGAAVLTSLKEWDRSKELATINIPTLVICGDRDTATPPNESFRIWQGIPKSTLCILPECAHMAHLEIPHVFYQILDRFLTARPIAGHR